ncbi:MAG: hypothetical protein LBT83_03855 [Tannerella sp.]|jgi:hypothetical protein|nr:hypothetical protein [Tannerella sp.]
MNTITKVYVAGLLLLIAIPFYGQDIKVTPTDLTKTYQGPKNEAQVDFVSAHPALKFRENNGEETQAPQKREDGKYVYTCICHVENRNKFVFNIIVQGATAEMSLQVYIEEHQHYIYNIDVAEIHATLGDIKMVKPNVIIPTENTSIVTVTTDYNKLIVESITGEKVDGPKLNNNGAVIYEFTFNLSTPESRQIQRGLKFSADGIDFKTFDLGTLSPKGGKEIAVVVLQSSCYQSNINRAQQSFINGLYAEAYYIYKKIIETDECEDKPSDLSEDKKRLEKMNDLGKVLQHARKCYEKAESFKNDGVMDSCRYYHDEAYKYRNYILKNNSSDAYCLEYNRIYQTFIRQEALRTVTVSGKTVNNVRMDVNGNHLPVEGVYIVLSAHKRDTKKVNGVEVPSPGDEIEGERRVLGQSAADGSFSVFVPRNNKKTIYVLHFTADKNFSPKSYSIDFTPKDDKNTKDLIIKLTPKKLNDYNN